MYLDCVVNADGTVGEVRVAKSLDTKNGLDASAIAAVKQWVFSPAVRNGRPVSTSVRVDVAFTLRGAPRSLTWPDGFAPPTAPASTAEWKSETLETDGLRIEIHYPPAWTFTRNPADKSLATLARPGTISRMSIARPRKVSYSLDKPMTPVELEPAGEEMERTIARTGGSLHGRSNHRPSAHTVGSHAQANSSPPGTPAFARRPHGTRGVPSGSTVSRR